jgi:hypothetical protein
MLQFQFLTERRLSESVTTPFQSFCQVLLKVDFLISFTYSSTIVKLLKMEKFCQATFMELSIAHHEHSFSIPRCDEGLKTWTCIGRGDEMNTGPSFTIALLSVGAVSRIGSTLKSRLLLFKYQSTSGTKHFKNKFKRVS